MTMPVAIANIAHSPVVVDIKHPVKKMQMDTSKSYEQNELDMNRLDKLKIN